MSRTDDYKKTEDLEIDLIDMARSFFRNWKQLAACAIAGMLLLGGYGYLKNLQTAVPGDTAAEEQLTEEQQQAVADAVQLKKETDGLEEYVSASILMQADIYHKPRVLLQYCVYGTDFQSLTKIVESYSAFLTYGEAAEAVRNTDKTFKEIEAVYLTELISTWQLADSQNKIVLKTPEAEGSENAQSEKLFYIEVTGRDETMAQQFADALQTVLEKYTASVTEKCGRHRLALLNRISSTKIDNSLLAQQREKREQLKAGKSNLKTMTDSMSRIQKIAYEKEAGIENGEDEENAEVPEGQGKGILVKYFVFGLCAGIFVYGCVFACLYLMRNAVRSENEFRAYYKIPLYGSMPVKKAGKKSGKLPGSAGNSYEHRLEQTLGRIRLACKKQGIEKLCLAAEFSAGTKEQDILELFAKQLQEWGIQTVLGNMPDSDVSQWNLLEETGTVLLACRTGVTAYPMVDNAMEFYLENDITVLGAVLFHSR